MALKSSGPTSYLSKPSAKNKDKDDCGNIFMNKIDPAALQMLVVSKYDAMAGTANWYQG